MLRSTGFFRGIDCPFSTERSDGSRCDRPYCHFRHSGHRRDSCSTSSNRGAREPFSQHKEQGYPYNPEVEDQQNGEPVSDPLAGVLELELVNRAIEAMRSEVEREQKKLSRIGDQEYDPTTSRMQAGAKRLKALAVASPFEYDPGSYQMTPAANYNPTPCSSKYTLDSDEQNSYANALEYVPTTVVKPATKKLPPFSQTPPSSPPSFPASSSKYTLDNSKPPTDLEYDPLSNFSARPGSKNSRSPKEPRSVGVVGAGTLASNKRLHSAIVENQTTDEGYVLSPKKSRQQPLPPAVIDCKKYSASFSESDDESSGTEYRPTTISRLKQKRISTELAEDPLRKGWETGEFATAAKVKRQLSLEDREERSGLCVVEESGSSDVGLPDDQVAGKKQYKNCEKKSSKTCSEQKESYKKSSSLKNKGGHSGGDGKKADTFKKPGKAEFKKDGRSEGGKVEEKARVKDCDKNKGGKGVKKAKSDVKVEKGEKLKGDPGSKEKEGGGGTTGPKRIKVSDKSGKDPSRLRDQKNGKLENHRIGKDKKVTGHWTESSKDKKMQPKSCLDGKVCKPEKQRSLSHADLFGDESPEEEEHVVRKSAAAFKKRSSLDKRTVSEVTSSSSDDESKSEDRTDDEDVYSNLQGDLDFDSDPMEECLRIFNESKDVKTEDKGRQAKQLTKEAEDEENTESTLSTLFPGQKKRVSHFITKGNVELTSKPVVRPYRRPTPQEICYQRMQIAQQQAAQLAAAVKTSDVLAGPISSFSGEKKRVAHRPYPVSSAANSGAAAGKQTAGPLFSPSQAGLAMPSVKKQTCAGILSKTTTTVPQKRVAHTPTLKSSSMKRPVIPTEFGAKVPTNVRQRYLNIFIDECLKLCPSEESAFQMALEEEKVAYDRSSSRNIYLNVAINTLKKLRSKSSSSAPPVTKKLAVNANKKSLSHEEVLGGRLAAKTSFTINRMGKQQEEELTDATLYRKLKAYVMTEDQLQEHGYPRPHPDRPGRAVVHNLPEKKNTDPFARVCSRCGTEYKVTTNGNCVRKEECTHHWGRLRRQRVPGGWETQYSCCSGVVGSPGCQVAKQHVQDGRKEALDGYVKTFSKPLPVDGNAGVYALDCEMCYTKLGLELTRVTVVNSELKVIYDTFVKPESKVVDYNTRFSGVTPEDLENTTITLRDVQAVLLSMFNADTILIGHSLESDLFALKLLHNTVVDTAIVFPHRLGLPYKRALRTLMADYLKRIIQDNVEGHDSSEDACACMELMIWKIREDAKVKR
ncbi:RNA exonuclease 1-like [Scleropages formosus]|uniref:RNA exonuclease 1-like n=1 Tax=Scleropages formosus TaxID=113540 RepID=A0A0P7USE0_SCLFO|nr:RNA exonuclease 1 homolog isoform X2 [Scleropages formosus]KPP72348.1 RNA exonuclease 1-like [Scleropages formosus]